MASSPSALDGLPGIDATALICLTAGVTGKRSQQAVFAAARKPFRSPGGKAIQRVSRQESHGVVTRPVAQIPARVSPGRGTFYRINTAPVGYGSPSTPASRPAAAGIGVDRASTILQCCPAFHHALRPNSRAHPPPASHGANFR